MRLFSPRLCLQASIILVPMWFFSSMHFASADDSKQQLNMAASKRLGELQLAETKLLTDIDICHRQIDAYQKILNSRETDLSTVRDQIKTIEVAFRWL